MASTQLDIANQALESVNNASSTARGLFTAFLLMTAYLAITFNTVTDIQLLKYSPINLPIINVGVDMKSFYILAPWLYMVMHANMLLMFSLITDKINHLEQVIQALNHTQRMSFRKRLHLLIFAQYLSKQHTGFLKTIIGLIIWLSIGLFPLLLLLSAQLAFLPAQEETVLWLQRLCIVVDAGLICYFWNSILQRRRMALLTKEWQLPQWRKRTSSAQALYFISFTVVYFSIFIATIPCGWWDTKMNKCMYTGPNYITQKTLDDSSKFLGGFTLSNIFEKSPDIYDVRYNFINPLVSITHYLFDNARTRQWKRHLIINNQIITENTLNAETRSYILSSNINQPIDDKVMDSIIGIDLSNRNFRFADFSKSHFPKVNFTGSQLSKAELGHINLQGANLAWANFENIHANYANLQGSNLNSSNFQSANLIFANLNEVSVIATNFQNAKLSNVGLENITNSRFLSPKQLLQ